MDQPVPFSEPFASTSRAVFTLPYKPAQPSDHEHDAFADEAALARYDQAWSTCNAKINSILASLHDASLDQIVAYVRSPPSDAQSLYAALAGRAPIRAGLIIGASPGSSSLLYASLTRQLAAPDPRPDPHSAGAMPSATPRRPCLVSRLASRDCSSIKNALRSLIGGFVGSDVEIEADDEDDEDGQGQSWGPATLKSALIVPEDLQNLQAWYEHRFGKKDSADAPTLVVLLEDLEAMDGKVLTQLIDALACYTSTLPLTLLVGIATTADAFFGLVSRPTAHQLDAASFFVDPGVGAFNALVRGLFIDWLPPLGLAPRTYTDLWRTFEDLHHSIDATISFIQYLYMTHFTSNPLAALTLPLPSSPSLSTPLPDATLSALRALPSLRSSPSFPLAATLLSPTTSPSALHDALHSARSALEAWHAERRVAFECLLGVMDLWDKRRGMEGVLGAVLGEGGGGAGRQGGKGNEGREGDGEVGRLVEGLCGLVLQASSTKLPQFLRALSTRLDHFLSSSSSSSSSSSRPLPNTTTLPSFLTAQLAALEPVLAAPRPAGRATLFNTNLAGAGAMGMGAGALGGGAGEADREFSRVARETAEGLKARLRAALRPPTDLVLHEVWFTSDSSAMKRLYPTLAPSLLRQLTKLDPLADPSYAAPAPDLNRNPSDADQRAVNVDAEETTPADLGVAWRVYRETHAQGRLVNLGEWWAGFELGAVDEGEGEGEGGGGGAGNGGGRGERGRKRARGEGDGEDGEEEDEESEEEEEEEEDEEGGPERRKQARFLRAVGDLAHLGFIHPTTYKPEHVLKSVY
ncbi:origin recognition complex subunit 3 N-terminus-domain-containing protein [Rhodotorula diobovata]|uniref:Origin recognition complex subunit 3 N-terminus-domain-containing protein n=1 Tax=Rhodotorula diobovata TaxID=5288 RepID=A0A5C5G5N9_9BASI|nr:origin recognition complex subunit 3 N-terminus-domain-containing protein [Rhodotorula diobovata]